MKLIPIMIRTNRVQLWEGLCRYRSQLHRKIQSCSLTLYLAVQKLNFTAPSGYASISTLPGIVSLFAPFFSTSANSGPGPSSLESASPFFTGINSRTKKPHLLSLSPSPSCTHTLLYEQRLNMGYPKSVYQEVW